MVVRTKRARPYRCAFAPGQEGAFAQHTRSKSWISTPRQGEPAVSAAIGRASSPSRTGFGMTRENVSAELTRRLRLPDGTVVP